MTPFADLFETQFAPKLGKRAEGFRAIFHALSTDRPLIIETGCMRIPGNWEGDGQSTIQFDAFAREHSGRVFTLDISADHLQVARSACSTATTCVMGDSIASLHALSSMGRADLIYLDSFDLDPNTPMPSAVHHILELTAARPLMGHGTLIAIDDCEPNGGKGMIVSPFLEAIRARLIYSGYQRVWQL